MSDSEASCDRSVDEKNKTVDSSLKSENLENDNKEYLKRNLKDESTEEEPASKRKREFLERRLEPKSEISQYKPSIKPFKIFILGLDDFISEEDAVKTYKNYKFDMKKKYLNNFFEKHRDEEWFMNLYHPDFKDAHKDGLQKKLKGRLDIFLDLFEKGYVDGQSVQINNMANIKKLFDAVMIKLSGGTDDDLMPLDDKDASSVDAIKEEEATIETNSFRDEIFQYEALCIRNLPPSVMPKDLEDECKTKDGFLRFSITPPNMEKKLTRTAWATYKFGVPIKKYCWELNSCRLIRSELLPLSKDLSVSVHRPNSQRILPVNSLTMHKDVMLSDLRSAATLVAKLDEKYDLWGQNTGDQIDDDEIDSNNSQEIPWMSGTFTSNPLMKSVNEYINEENQQNPDSYNEKSMTLVFDVNLARVLDLLIFYLRIVHSYDYYSATFYYDEDNMPHKCSILHSRGDRSITFDDKNVPSMIFKAKDMFEYTMNFRKKIDQIIHLEFSTSEDEEYLSLGPRDTEDEKKKFIEANILKKISKKKPFKVVWMCPFSDKKFREPIYVEKHILNKHFDKIEAVIKEVQYFNDYLKSTNRPAQPDPPRYVVEQAFSKEFIKFGDGKISIHGNFSSPRSTGRYGRRNNNGRFNYDGEKSQQQALAAVSAVAANINSQNPAEILQKALYMMNSNNGNSNNSQRNHYHPYRQNYNGPNRRGGPNRDFISRPKPSGKDRRIVSYNDLDNPNTDEM